MDNLHKIARACYEKGSDAAKQSARTLFRKIDTNGDGVVNRNEFIYFLTTAGVDAHRSQKYFQIFDKDGNGSLDFWEAVTFVYLFTVGRSACDCCSSLLLDVQYFTCCECFTSTHSYDICVDCFVCEKPSWSHVHPRPSFVDSYHLLRLQAKYIENAPTDQQVSSSNGRMRTIVKAADIVSTGINVFSTLTSCTIM